MYYNLYINPQSIVCAWKRICARIRKQKWHSLRDKWITKFAYCRRYTRSDGILDGRQQCGGEWPNSQDLQTSCRYNTYCVLVLEMLRYEFEIEKKLFSKYKYLKKRHSASKKKCILYLLYHRKYQCKILPCFRRRRRETKRRSRKPQRKAIIFKFHSSGVGPAH